jgi:acyl-CoA thioesterase-1
MIKKLIFLLCLGLLLAGQAVASQTLVFLGDSLTAGMGLRSEQAYPALVESLLQADGLDWRVVNAGISGDTTAGGLKRLDWLLRARPKVVFVALGANDGLRGLDVQHTRDNLEAIIVKLQNKGARVVLAGIYLPLNYGPEYTGKFKAVFPFLAKKYRLPLMPFLLQDVAAVPSLNQADGIHPTAEGQAIIARNVFRFLKPILQNPN